MSMITPFPSETFIPQKTIRGDCWSGGTYITPQEEFDPTDLIAGLHQIVFTDSKRIDVVSVTIMD